MADTGLLKGGPLDGCPVHVESVVATVQTFAGPYKIASIAPLTYEWVTPAKREVKP